MFEALLFVFVVTSVGAIFASAELRVGTLVVLTLVIWLCLVAVWLDVPVDRRLVLLTACSLGICILGLVVELAANLLSRAPARRKSS